MGSKIIYTVDTLKTENNIDETLKPFGTHIQINETERTYVITPDFNPEVEEMKTYVGPTESEKDVVLYKEKEPQSSERSYDLELYKKMFFGESGEL